MPTNKTLNSDTYVRSLLIVSAVGLLGSGCWGLRVVPAPTERSGKIVPAVMYRLSHAHITPRAAVSTDHGPLVRNPLNNDQGEQILRDEQRRCGAVSREKSMNQTTIDTDRFHVAQIAPHLARDGDHASRGSLPNKSRSGKRTRLPSL
jgi:hypothetical protein